MVPCHGTYLIVQLDAVRMVEPLQDPVLLAAARVLPSQKYVAHVLEVAFVCCYAQYLSNNVKD